MVYVAYIREQARPIIYVMRRADLFYPYLTAPTGREGVGGAPRLALEKIDPPPIAYSIF